MAGQWQLTLPSLHMHPEFPPKILAAVANPELASKPPRPDGDFEQVRVHMLTQNLDDMHKLWSALRAHYASSVV